MCLHCAYSNISSAHRLVGAALTHRLVGAALTHRLVGAALTHRLVGAALTVFTTLFATTPFIQYINGVVGN